MTVKRFLNIFCVGIVLLSMKVQGQELLSEPDARLITTIPVRFFSGSVMVVKATVGNYRDSLNFILDTGSGGISLDSTTSRVLNIPTRLTDTTITGIGGVKKVEFAFNQSLHLPGLTVAGLNFHINDYDVLSSVYGERIDGIIGYSFFSRYIVQVNFDSMKMKVFSPGKFLYPVKGVVLNPVITSVPILNMKMKERKTFQKHFYFDMGAGLCFLLSEQFAKDSAVLLSRRKPVSTRAEGMLGTLELRQTIVKEVKIGPYRFNRVPTYLYDDKYNVTSYPFSGGLIGNEILKRFNITLNYPKRQIHIVPNKAFNEPFDYSYSGMGFYFHDGKIIIGDVVKKSPADKAGLKTGDEIIAIDNNPSRNIQEYKNMLQIAFQKFKIIIMRDGQLYEKFLTTGKIN